MNISLSPKKYGFLMNAGTILGHSICEKGIKVDPNEVVIIKRVPTPKNKGM